MARDVVIKSKALHYPPPCNHNLFMGSQSSKWGQWLVTNTEDGYQQLSYYILPSLYLKTNPRRPQD